MRLVFPLYPEPFESSVGERLRASLQGERRLAVPVVVKCTADTWIVPPKVCSMSGKELEEAFAQLRQFSVLCA